MEEAKNKRRSAKSAFTRIENSLEDSLAANRTVPEVNLILEMLYQKLVAVEVAHDMYTELLNDDDFEGEQKWMSDIQKRYDKASVRVNDYVTKVREHCPVEDKAKSDRNLNMPKIPLPKFSGKIDDYLIFKRDWQKIVERRYGQSDDALYLLMNSLENPNPSINAKKWVEGVTDYKEAWLKLDAVYGNPRETSDSLIGDLEKLRQLGENDFSRFIEFYHKVKKAQNIMAEMNRSADLDNSTTLGVLERKLCFSDKIKWAEHQLKDSVTPNIETFLAWMWQRIQINKIACADIRGTKRSGPSVLFATDQTDNRESDSWQVNSLQTQSAGTQNTGPSSNLPPAKQKICWYCKSNHAVFDCPNFKRLQPNERLKEVQKMRACYFCLNKHRFPCTAKKVKCMLTTNNEPCAYHHHTLLHGADFKKRESTNYIGSGQKLLPIVSQKIGNSENDIWETGNILLDSGSDFCLIRDAFAQKLELRGEPDRLNFTIASGQTVNRPCMSYNVLILGKNGTKYPVRVKGIDRITDDAPPIDIKPLADKFCLDEKSISRRGGPVDILIGIDHIDFQAGSTVTIDNLAYRDTCIGPVFYGVNSISNIKDSCTLNNIIENFDLERFWSVESMGVVEESECKQKLAPYRKKLSPCDTEIVNDLRNKAELSDGRWTIPVPWRKDPHDLPNNYTQVKAKLISTEKRLMKSPEHSKMYDQQIKDLVDSGSVRILSEDEIKNHNGPTHYLSHHAVYRYDKPTHPCRVVFNLAAQYEGHVLNDYIHQGGDHLNSLLGVLLRWRENCIPIVGDISRMFHQVLMDQSSSHTHRFLWRNLNVSIKPEIYVTRVWTFGNVASPAIANLALDMTAERNLTNHREAALSILNQRYMDDLAESLKSTDLAEKRIVEIDDVLRTGNFKIKSWSSSEHFPGISNCTGNEKVLGTTWNKDEDTVKIQVSKTRNIETTDSLTKRKVLGLMSSAFDVFGLGCPVIITGKILMQELWTLKFEWDAILPTDITLKWQNWLTELKQLPGIEIQRCITPATAVGNPELITFSDASKKAFGSVCYLRWLLEDGRYDVKFILAKSRVAPLRQITLARLELQSAVLAARLTDVIKTQIRLQLKSITHFTDSMIVLGWIRNENRTDPVFIANRTGEIQTKTIAKDWRHLPSNFNVADDISRGIKAEKLMERFIPGPEFLRYPEEQWPHSEIEHATATTESENVRSAKKSRNENKPILDIEHLVTLRPLIKVVRITAMVFRFYNNVRALVAKRKRDLQSIAKRTRAKIESQSESCVRYLENDPITAAEIESAKIKLIIMAQSHLDDNYQKAYVKLTPFKDDEIIRVGGRAGESELTYNENHPILLPKNHWLSLLIVEHVHRFGHPGVATTAARVRSAYWIIKLNKLAKYVVYHCVFCREMSARFEEQFMASLPSYRLKPSPPFYNCACDLFGPYNVKVSRNKTQKFWGVLFTCLVTRSVYGDITADYSAMEFIQTFKRFVCIRGFPNSVLSDNGSQLVAASKEIKNWCANRSIEWHFTTPTAAHQNGCVESLIKSVKKAMNSIMKGVNSLTALELQTLVFEAVNLVNERPIGLLPSDPNDGRYICPNDILLGRSGISVPQGKFDDTKDPRKRVEFVQKLVKSFWDRWHRDVFPTLVPRKKWSITRRNVKIDDYVLMSDPAPERGKWTKGRVIDVFPGKDGKVRNVKVKTARNVFERPISKIVVLLPVEEQ